MYINTEMRKILIYLTTFVFIFLGIFSLMMFMYGDPKSYITWVWLFPAQILVQPSYTKMLELAKNFLGEKEKPKDDE